MSKRSFRTALIIVLGTLVILGAVGGLLVKWALEYPDQRHAGSGKEVPVHVDKGMAFPAIASRLADLDVIDKPRWFRLYAMHRGVTTGVRSGDYVLRDDMTPCEVLDKLLEGPKEVTVAVTIPEGLNMLEALELIADAKISDYDQLVTLARDPAFLAKHGIDADSIEGYLFPETYRFRAPTPADKVLATLIKQQRVVWDRIRRDDARKVERLRKRMKWSDHDILIMASIVEKEAKAAAERPRIAQVFINRLVSPSFRPHRLDTDPTIRYGCTVPLVKSAACQKWDPGDRLHRAQLDDADNPYNTYQHEGLPPGPICSPGEAALRATVDPDGSGYFYFVAKNDGTHVFAKTRREHERNVDKYQR